VGGHRANIITVLVLSGVSTRADLPKCPVPPDFVFENVQDLAAAWKKRYQTDATPVPA
jgi:ribonucleotide monophosphatase NagD (HAD superfamily)